MTGSKDAESRAFWRKNNPVAYGVLISILVLVGYAVVGFRTECAGSVCINNFQKFWGSEPNEVGDTLAGLFGALAFIWIIATVFLQSQELREQRKEFREQRLATQDMAKAMAAQATIFLDEQQSRQHTNAQQLFDEHLRSLILEIDRLSRQGIIWHFSNREIDFEFDNGGEVHTVLLSDYLDLSKPIDEVVRDFAIRVGGIHDRLWDYTRTSIDWRLPPKIDFVSRIEGRIQRIRAVERELSEAQKVRASRLNLDEIQRQLMRLQNTPELWDEVA